MLTCDNLIQCHDAQCQWRARAFKPEFNLKVEFSGMTRDRATESVARTFDSMSRPSSDSDPAWEAARV